MLIFISLVILCLDQFTKFLIKSHMVEYSSIPIIPDIFHLTFVHNTGAAFSILAGKTSFFIGVTLLALLAGLYFYWRLPREEVVLRWGIALTWGGAWGNLIDRLRFGQVVDFLDFRIWPVFNIADCAVVMGVVLICWQLIKMEFWPQAKEKIN